MDLLRRRDVLKYAIGAVALGNLAEARTSIALSPAIVETHYPTRLSFSHQDWDEGGKDEVLDVYFADDFYSIERLHINEVKDGDDIFGVCSRWTCDATIGSLIGSESAMKKLYTKLGSVANARGYVIITGPQRWGGTIARMTTVLRNAVIRSCDVFKTMKNLDGTVGSDPMTECKNIQIIATGVARYSDGQCLFDTETADMLSPWRYQTPECRQRHLDEFDVAWEKQFPARRSFFDNLRSQVAV